MVTIQIACGVFGYWCQERRDTSEYLDPCGLLLALALDDVLDHGCGYAVNVDACPGLTLLYLLLAVAAECRSTGGSTVRNGTAAGSQRDAA